MEKKMSNLKNETDKNWIGDDVAKELWDSDQSLREEFHGNYESYLAASKAISAGLVKTYGEGTGLRNLVGKTAAKDEWGNNQNLRAQWDGDYESFLAYYNAVDAGRVKVLGNS